MSKRKRTCCAHRCHPKAATSAAIGRNMFAPNGRVTDTEQPGIGNGLNAIGSTGPDTPKIANIPNPYGG